MGDKYSHLRFMLLGLDSLQSRGKVTVKVVDQTYLGYLFHGSPKLFKHGRTY